MAHVFVDIIAAFCAADQSSDDLLEEAAAAVDANTALIQRGIAEYRIVETRYAAALPSSASSRAAPVAFERAERSTSERGPLTADVTVYFDYPKLRFDWRGQRLTVDGSVVHSDEWTIYNSQERMHYSFVSKPRGPQDYRVRIDASPRGPKETTGLIHPRQQANDDWSFGSDALSRRRSNKKLTLTGTVEPDGLLRIVLVGPTGKMHFWLSPAHAYSTVRSKWWRAQEDPETEAPYRVYEATYRDAGNGAFVLDHRVSDESTFVDGVKQPFRDEEVTLVKIEMRQQLDEKRFSLEGLGLPVGARIIDAVHGRDYDYGVPAVAENDVQPPRPAGAIARSEWLVAAFAAIGVGLAALLAIKVRRSRNRRPHDHDV